MAFNYAGYDFTDNAGNKFSGDERFTNFAWNAGAGVAFNINDHFTIDAGYRFVSLGYNDVSVTSGGNKYDVGNRPYNNEFMLEVNIRQKQGNFELRLGFHLTECGIAVIFGPSGSGKTSLINCIAGLETPDAGHIACHGATCFDADQGINLPPEKRRLGYVFQDARLFPHLSVRDNLRFGMMDKLRARAPEHKISAEVDSLEQALLVAEAGIDIVQCEKFAYEALAETVGALRSVREDIVILAAGGINGDNAAQFAATGVDVLVTSWPFFGKPADIKVVMEKAPTES